MFQFIYTFKVPVLRELNVYIWWDNWSDNLQLYTSNKISCNMQQSLTEQNFQYEYTVVAEMIDVTLLSKGINQSSEMLGS